MKKVAIAVFVLALAAPAFTQEYHNVVINFTASPDSTVAGYHLYRRAEFGTKWTQLNPIGEGVLIAPGCGSIVSPCSVDDETVKAGETYWYEIRAVNSSGIEAPPTNELQVNVPANGAPAPASSLTLLQLPN